MPRIRPGVCVSRSTNRESTRARPAGPRRRPRMFRRRPKGMDGIHDPNLTPLIDVALVLVIILLVTAPLISVADLGVHLPQAHTREAEDERNVSITLGTDGRLALDDRTIARDQLRALLAARLAEPGNDHVLV